MTETSHKNISSTQGLHATAKNVVISNFFKSAQDLTQEEFEEVMLTLESKEARCRFSQQRKYGKRSFLQEAVDRLEFSNLRDGNGRHGGITGTTIRPIGLTTPRPLLMWSEVPDIFKVARAKPLTRQELADVWKLLRQLRGNKATFAETVRSL